MATECSGHTDKARGEAARAHRAQRRRPSLSQAAHPDDIGAGAADRLRETKRGWGGPFDPGHTLDFAQLLDRIESDAVVAQIEHERQAAARLGHPLDIGDYTARRHKR